VPRSGLGNRKKALVPRGGIEFSYMPLNSYHFFYGRLPVYPSMYPSPNSHAVRCAEMRTFFGERRAGKRVGRVG
jgi:hypothetical protein